MAGVESPLPAGRGGVTITAAKPAGHRSSLDLPALVTVIGNCRCRTGRAGTAVQGVRGSRRDPGSTSNHPGLGHWEKGASPVGNLQVPPPFDDAAGFLYYPGGFHVFCLYFECYAAVSPTTHSADGSSDSLVSYASSSEGATRPFWAT